MGPRVVRAGLASSAWVAFLVAGPALPGCYASHRLADPPGPVPADAAVAPRCPAPAVEADGFTAPLVLVPAAAPPARRANGEVTVVAVDDCVHHVYWVEEETELGRGTEFSVAGAVLEGGVVRRERFVVAEGSAGLAAARDGDNAVVAWATRGDDGRIRVWRQGVAVDGALRGEPAPVVGLSGLGTAEAATLDAVDGDPASIVAVVDRELRVAPAAPGATARRLSPPGFVFDGAQPSFQVGRAGGDRLVVAAFASGPGGRGPWRWTANDAGPDGEATALPLLGSLGLPGRAVAQARGRTWIAFSDRLGYYGMVLDGSEIRLAGFEDDTEAPVRGPVTLPGGAPSIGAVDGAILVLTGYRSPRLMLTTVDPARGTVTDTRPLAEHVGEILASYSVAGDRAVGVAWTLGGWGALSYRYRPAP